MRCPGLGPTRFSGVTIQPIPGSFGSSSKNGVIGGINCLCVPIYEVMMLARITTSDLQSTTGTNIMTIQRELGLDPTSVSARQVRQMDLKRPVPERDFWRLTTIKNMIERRRDLQTSLSDTSDIDFVISGLCTT